MIAEQVARTLPYTCSRVPHPCVPIPPDANPTGSDKHPTARDDEFMIRDILVEGTRARFRKRPVERGGPFAS